MNQASLHPHDGPLNLPNARPCLARLQTRCGWKLALGITLLGACTSASPGVQPDPQKSPSPKQEPSSPPAQTPTSSAKVPKTAEPAKSEDNEEPSDRGWREKSGGFAVHIGECEYSFGSHMSLSDDLLSISAPGAGKNGEIFVYRRSKSGWNQEARLEAAGSETHEAFDWSLASSENQIVLAAPWLPRAGYPAGLVIVYSKRGKEWTRTAQLTVDSTGGAELGLSVALSGNVLAVGASEGPSRLERHGLVIIYERKGTDWVETQRVRPAVEDKLFGAAVALSSSLLLVGAPQLQGPGYAELFTRKAGKWKRAQRFTNEGREDSEFGNRLAVAKRVIAVGSMLPNTIYVYSPNKAGWTATLALDVSEEAGNRHDLAFLTPLELGVGAYVNGNALTFNLREKAKQGHFPIDIPYPEVEPRDLAALNFATTVVASPNTLVVAASGADDRSGAVHVYERHAGVWKPAQRLRPDCSAGRE